MAMIKICNVLLLYNFLRPVEIVKNSHNRSKTSETVFVKIVLLNILFHLVFFLRNTIIVLGSFLDAFQKIADAATNTKGKIDRFCYCKKSPRDNLFILSNNVMTYLMSSSDTDCIFTSTMC